MCHKFSEKVNSRADYCTVTLMILGAAGGPAGTSVVRGVPPQPIRAVLTAKSS